MVPLEEKLAGLLYRLKCDKAGETLGEEELRGIRESLGHVDAMYHEGGWVGRGAEHRIRSPLHAADATHLPSSSPCMAVCAWLVQGTSTCLASRACLQVRRRQAKPASHCLAGFRTPRTAS